MADSAADLAAIADRLGWERFAVCGVSAGGPCALAAAALLPDRVTRCATIVGIGPSDAPDLDFQAGMSAEEVSEWEGARAGELFLAGEFYRETVAWAESIALMDGLDPPVAGMLSEELLEGLRSPDGMVDEYASHLMPWGFAVADIACPTRIMIAVDDTSVPPAHGRWLVSRIASAEAWEVPGGHVGPRDSAEEELLAWLASA